MNASIAALACAPFLVTGLAAQGTTPPAELSADGRYVIVLTATPLVPGDTNGRVDVFRKDLQTQAVIRVSRSTGGRQASSGSSHPWISPDGGLVGFVCGDDTLAPGDELDGYSDVYLHTVATGQTVLVTGGS